MRRNNNNISAVCSCFVLFCFFGLPVKDSSDRTLQLEPFPTHKETLEYCECHPQKYTQCADQLSGLIHRAATTWRKMTISLPDEKKIPWQQTKNNEFQLQSLESLWSVSSKGKKKRKILLQFLQFCKGLVYSRLWSCSLCHVSLTRRRRRRRRRRGNYRDGKILLTSKVSG